MSSSSCGSNPTPVYIGDEVVSLADVDRLVVVGGGKAGSRNGSGSGKMPLEPVATRLQLNGWINIPEGSSRETRYLHLHPARPAGRNEPTRAGVDGARKMLDMIGSLGPRDWCLVLISGGGSA